MSTENKVNREAEINFKIGLREDNQPIKIEWDASDAPGGGLKECKAFSIAIFDKEHNDTMRMDLWTPEMQVVDMNKFVFESLFTLADTFERATKNSKEAEKLRNFAKTFGVDTEVLKP